MGARICNGTRTEPEKVEDKPVNNDKISAINNDETRGAGGANIVEPTPVEVDASSKRVINTPGSPDSKDKSMKRTPLALGKISLNGTGPWKRTPKINANAEEIELDYEDEVEEPEAPTAGFTDNMNTSSEFTKAFEELWERLQIDNPDQDPNHISLSEFQSNYHDAWSADTMFMAIDDNSDDKLSKSELENYIGGNMEFLNKLLSLSTKRKTARPALGQLKLNTKTIDTDAKPIKLDYVDRIEVPEAPTSVHDKDELAKDDEFEKAFEDLWFRLQINDSDGDPNHISLSEFISNYHAVWGADAVFQAADNNQDNRLSKEELRNYLGGNLETTEKFLAISTERQEKLAQTPVE